MAVLQRFDTFTSQQVVVIYGVTKYETGARNMEFLEDLISDL